MKSNNDRRSKTLYLVLGMHRSGTSALTGRLNETVASIPLMNILGATKDNKLGHFENVDVIDIHDRILNEFSMNWASIGVMPALSEVEQRCAADLHKLDDFIKDSFLGTDRVLIKDPRICRLFPIWRALCEQEAIALRKVFIFRFPLDVARSLRKRNGISLNHGLLIWIRYNLDALRSLGAPGFVAFEYDALIQMSGRDIYRRLSKAFPDLKAQGSVDDSASFPITGNLRTQNAERGEAAAQEDVNGKIWETCSSLFDAMQGLADIDVAPTDLDDFETRMHSLCCDHEVFCDCLDTYFDNTVEMKRKIAELERRLSKTGWGRVMRIGRALGFTKN